MNLVNLEQAAKAYHERVLLDRVSLGVSAGQRIGVVGRNGAGKTTLLAALAGKADLDSGRTTRARDVTIGYLPQAEELTGTVAEVAFGDVAEHEWAAQPRSRAVIEALLGGLDVAADVSQLSGGERRRTALAALLRGSYDLLLLDEPTNHLDIEAITWLAGYLREHVASCVVVTHDRWFLDTVTEQTWEVADGQVHAYDGGYSAYVLARAERARVAAVLDMRRRNLLRKELAWLRRGPPARTSKPKFRIEAASELIADEPPARDGVELARLAAVRLGKTVLELEDVSVSAGDRCLLDDVTWQLGPGDRVGVVGVNGSGKTTLLRLLAGRLALPSDGATGVSGGLGLAARGRLVTGATVRMGYLTQEPTPVDEDLRVLEAAEQVRGTALIGKRELSVSQLLDRLGLRGERQWTRVGDLSGGERRRLQILLMLLAEPNVLLLDEPTNDLDIETLTELEDLLDGWAGSVVVVSHDRYFLERTTDHVQGLLNGQLAYLPGGVDEYLSRREMAQANSTSAIRDRSQLGRAPGRQPPPGNARSGEPGAGDVRATPTAARQRAGQKELARLERQISKLADTESRLAEDLAASASDYERLVELGAELRAVESERAGLEERWLELAEELG